MEKSNIDQSVEERYRQRQSQSKPILDKLKKWLDQTLANTPPKSSLGNALSYFRNQWPRLCRYVEGVKLIKMLRKTVSDPLLLVVKTGCFQRVSVVLKPVPTCTV
ncbi:MAG: transposase [Pseudomonadales bacterium]|nr:transposase [Pseudomonadales bacterium]